MHTPDHREILEQFKASNPTAAQWLDAAHHEVEDADTLTRPQHIVSGVCCLIAAGIMIETLFFKFTGAAESKYIFSSMGTEPWMRWVQGLGELTASIGLLMPRFKRAGGILTTGAMAAAILSHMTWLGYSIQGDHGLLFLMAITMFSCGVTVLMLHRDSIPNYTRMTSW